MSPEGYIHKGLSKVKIYYLVEGGGIARKVKPIRPDNMAIIGADPGIIELPTPALKSPCILKSNYLLFQCCSIT